MLESLVIENYAVARHVSLSLNRGLSAITGETGAGKSIAIDALTLVLGGRTDVHAIRPGAQSSGISAVFSISDAPRALAYLKDHDLLEEDPNLCVIRRTISLNGHSRAFINDIPVTTKTLKEISPLLLNIHGQHDEQLLVLPERQLAFLDAFSELGPEVSEVASLYHTYNEGRTRLKKLAEEQDAGLAEYKLTHYQIAELEKFNPQKNEFTDLSNEYDRLNHIQILEEGTSYVSAGIEDEGGLLSSIRTLSNKLENLAEIDGLLTPLCSSLESARLNIEDVGEQLRVYQDKLESDPARTLEINTRMGQYTDLARKYGVKPDELYNVLKELHKKAESFTSIKEQIEECKAAVIKAREDFMEKSLELRDKRIAKAPDFAKHVTDMLKELSMPDAVFEVKFSDIGSPSESGVDTINFVFSANKGLPPDLINKTASGGEISRIALSVLVLTASKISAPTLIFDEIDTGISGRTAAITGKLLRMLGKHSQVITVTHLPQVAASAHQQYEVKKSTVGDITESSVTLLDNAGREQEIARLLGSSAITETTLANAREMLRIQSEDSENTNLIISENS